MVAVVAGNIMSEKSDRGGGRNMAAWHGSGVMKTMASMYFGILVAIDVRPFSRLTK